MPPAIRNGYTNLEISASAKKMLQIPPIIPSSANTPLIIMSPIPMPTFRIRSAAVRFSSVCEAITTITTLLITLMYSLTCLLKSTVRAILRQQKLPRQQPMDAYEHIHLRFLFVFSLLETYPQSLRAPHSLLHPCILPN